MDIFEMIFYIDFYNFMTDLSWMKKKLKNKIAWKTVYLNYIWLMVCVFVVIEDYKVYQANSLTWKIKNDDYQNDLFVTLNGPQTSAEK